MKDYETFEDYLKRKHAEQYLGTDDNMPEDFERWMSNLTPAIRKDLHTKKYLEFCKKYKGVNSTWKGKELRKMSRLELYQAVDELNNLYTSSLKDKNI